MSTDQNGSGAGKRIVNITHHFQTIGFRHVEIRNDQIRAQARDDIQSLCARSGLPDHPEILRRLEKRPDPRAKLGFIIGYDHPPYTPLGFRTDFLHA